MKKLITLAVALISFGGVATQAQTITGFGTGDFLINDPGSFFDFASLTQNATTATISGIDGGTSFFVTLATPVSVGTTLNSTKKLSLLATATTLNTNGFGLELFDVNGNSAAYSGSWSSFTVGNAITGNVTFVSKAPTFTGTVTALLLSTGGTGQTLNITLDSLALVPVVVPEPSTYAALSGAAVLGLVVYRRRKSTSVKV